LRPAANISFSDVCKKKAKPAVVLSKAVTDLRMAIKQVPEGPGYVFSAVADQEDGGKVTEGF